MTLAKRFIFGLFLLLGLGFIALSTSTPSRAQEGEGDTERIEAAKRGAVLYVQYCGACHGAEGEVLGTGAGFVSIEDYDPNFAEGRITNGFDSNLDDPYAMPGYGHEADGPLSEAQIDDLL